MPGVVAAERGVRGEDISTVGEQGDYGEDSSVKRDIMVGFQWGEQGDYGEDTSMKRDIMVRIPVGRAGRLW